MKDRSAQSRLALVAVGFGTLVACRPPAPQPQAEASAASSDAQAVDAGAPTSPEASAASEAPPVPPTPRVVSKATPVLDTSDWSAAPAGSTIDVVWYVRQDQSKLPPSPDAFFQKVPIELVLTLAGRAHKLALVGNAAGPAFPRCDPDLVSLEFYSAGMSRGFSIERVPPDRAVLTEHDAIGDSVDSPASPARDVRVFRVPKDAHFQQRIVVVAKGKTELCGPTGPP